ncbi:MAG: FAD-dependent monooxygenase [Steroidobacteraceae bacterium]
MTGRDADIIVVGAGVAGLACAALLRRNPDLQGLRVLLVDRNAPPRFDPTAPLRSRVLAVSRAGERLLQHVGGAPLSEHPRAGIYERMHVWHHSVAPTDARALDFDAAEIAEPNLGMIVENDLLQQLFHERALALGIATRFCEITGLDFAADSVVLTTSDGPLRGGLVIAADGARSRLRTLAGLGGKQGSFGQLALVGNFRTERSHQRTAWQRFLGDGTLALLPLADGCSSIVWATAAANAERLLALAPDALENELTLASAQVLGQLQAVTEVQAVPLGYHAADRYVLPRFALIGDAAHVVHPLAGQGANLGLLDAAALVQCLGEQHRRGEDCGALAGLRNYERWRKSENLAMAGAMNALQAVLATGSGSATRLAVSGLGWVNGAGPLKNFFARRALGLSGERPEALFRTQSAGRSWRRR